MTEVAESRVRALLASRAFLFTDPDAYLAGVDEALGVVADPGPRRISVSDRDVSEPSSTTRADGRNVA